MYMFVLFAAAQHVTNLHLTEMDAVNTLATREFLTVWIHERFTVHVTAGMILSLMT